MDTTQETSTQDSTAADAVADMTTNTESEWFVQDGVPGEGDAPTWFKGDKYKTVSDQAQAYPDLESKLGSFTGAPESYEVNVSEELTSKGIEFDSSDPLMEEAFKFAKESNMSQEGFDNMMNLYAMGKLADGEALEAHKAEQIKALGPSGQARLDNIKAWSNKNLPSDLIEGLEGMVTTAKSVEAVEQLIALTRSAPMQPDNATAPSANTGEDVKKMQFELDEHGNRRISTDPDYRKRYEKLRDEVYGTEPNRTLIG